jgi:hypothetical protein
MRTSMKQLGIALAFACASALAGGRTWAADPEVSTLLADMKASLEPGGTSIRTMTLKASGPDGAAAPITLQQARTTDGATRHILTVVLSPAEAAGTTVLLSEQGGTPEERWVYAPVVRRTRQIVPVLRYQPFLNSDFTYADLGFMDTRRTDAFKLLPPAQGDVHLYGVEETPEDRTVYSRIVSWIDADKRVPVKREMYDRNGKLWKIERFEDVRAMDGAMVPMRLVMEDVQGGGRTELVTTEIRRDVTLPDTLFDPTKLSVAASQPVWTAVAKTAAAATSGS